MYCEASNCYHFQPLWGLELICAKIQIEGRHCKNLGRCLFAWVKLLLGSTLCLVHKTSTERDLHHMSSQNQNHHLLSTKRSLIKKNLVKTYFHNIKVTSSKVSREVLKISSISQTRQNQTTVAHTPLYSINNGDFISRHEYETKASEKFQKNNFYLLVIFWLHKQ